MRDYYCILYDFYLYFMSNYSQQIWPRREANIKPLIAYIWQEFLTLKFND